MNIECFVAGIIKGLKEHGDISRHFGSTLALTFHWQKAFEAGLVKGNTKNPELTEKGLRAYEVWKLSEMPQGRSYLWPRLKFELNDL
jgi:hypothetical protein